MKDLNHTCLHALLEIHNARQPITVGAFGYLKYIGSDGELKNLHCMPHTVLRLFIRGCLETVTADDGDKFQLSDKGRLILKAGKFS